MRNVLEEAIRKKCDIILVNLKYKPIDKMLYSKDNKLISVDERSIEILELLLSNVGTPVNADTILTDIWKSKFISKNVVSNKVCFLRSIVKNNVNDIEARDIIKTYPKKGYYLASSCVKLDETEHKVKSDIKSVKPRTNPIALIIIIAITLSLFWIN